MTLNEVLIIVGRAIDGVRYPTCTEWMEIEQKLLEYSRGQEQTMGTEQIQAALKRMIVVKQVDHSQLWTVAIMLNKSLFISMDFTLGSRNGAENVAEMLRKDMLRQLTDGDVTPARTRGAMEGTPGLASAGIAGAGVPVAADGDGFGEF